MMRQTLVCLAVAGTLILQMSCDQTKEWKIGQDQAKHMSLVDASQPKSVRICARKYGGSIYPVRPVIVHDGDWYRGLQAGQCKTIKASHVELRFATPASYKYALGTYHIEAP